MKGPNSCRPLCARSFSILIVVFLISPLNVAVSQSVDTSNHHHPHHHLHHEVHDSSHVLNEGQPSLKNQPILTPSVNKNEEIEPEHSLASESGVSLQGSIGKSGIHQNEKLPSNQINKRNEQVRNQVEGSHGSSVKSVSSSNIRGSSSNVDQEGIRRFDALVVNEEPVNGIASSEKEKLRDGVVENLEVDKTVTKGIIVKDEPANADQLQGETYPHIQESFRRLKVYQKRSLKDFPSEQASAPKQPAQNVAGETIKIAHQESVGSHSEKLIPIIPNHAESSRQIVPEHVDSSSTKSNKQIQEKLSKEGNKQNIHVDQPDGTGNEKSETLPRLSPISEVNQAHEKSINKLIESNNNRPTKTNVVPEAKKITINENVLNKVEKESSEQVSNSRTFASPGKDDNKQQELIGAEKSDDDLKPEVKDQNASNLSALSSILTTTESLEEVKSQALSLQASLKNKTFLERLRDESIEILPQMPKFTEKQLIGALNAISLSKKIDETQYSYLPKIDTSLLNEDQLKIIRCAEALVVREQRQTFAENMFECIRGLSILNCMRIFVWPVIADNIPESFSQNLPTLPIEINIADLLPGRQKDKPKSSRLRSTVISPQGIFVTPELVVSNILKDALIAKPNDGAKQQTFIDTKNETLSKFLTSGQLEILRMAEMLLPESAREEYSEKMYSCVQRFEYFSCVKYFTWPMVKQYFADLPEFPNYHTWYPSVSVYPGYPILPYPNAEGNGKLPEVVEADATRTSGPKPEVVIVQILENTLRQIHRSPNLPTSYYSARYPAAPVPSITPDQMAIFYTAEQLIPQPMRSEFLSKTMKCIREYDYLTCTKYSTWPTVRQLYPSLPQFPDFSSWIPTFALPEVPDFSEYIPNFSSYFPTLPNFPGFPGIGSVGQQPQPQPQPQPTPQPETQPQPQPEAQPQPQPQPGPQPQPLPETQPPPQTQPQPQPQEQPGQSPVPDKPPYWTQLNSSDSSSVAKEDFRLSEPPNPIEKRIIQILSNIRLLTSDRNPQQVSSVTQGTLDILKGLTYSQLKILELSKSVVPAQVRGDLDARFVGCLQGNGNFLGCTRNVIWPTLQLYVKDLPRCPIEEKTKVADALHITPITPAIYQPVIRSPADIAGRSPLGGQIAAESEEELPSLDVRGQFVIPSGDSENHPSISQLRHKITEKSGDSLTPVISITDARFTPIYSDHPETVLLKILTTVRSSSKFSDDSQPLGPSSTYLESLNDVLNPDQLSVIQISENLLPAVEREAFMKKISKCTKESNFMACSRDVLWPTLLQYYPRLPSFPNFNINDDLEKKSELSASGSKKSFGPGAAISETDVKTGQHGDAMVTITDTRFIPIFNEHPEEVILGILKNLQMSLPSLSEQQGAISKGPTQSFAFTAKVTDQQGNIIAVAETLLPESIRQVFNTRMTECMKKNGFLDCTRDIAWPTIAQFFPRLPNFPNVGTLPQPAIDSKPAQPATLLPPHFEDAGMLALTVPQKPSIAVPAENFVSITPTEEVESRIESTLKHISSATKTPLQPKQSYASAKDPLISSLVTERQANVIRMCEELLPNSIKPIFVGKMVECSRADVFPNCIRNIGWPTLRQFVPNIPEFPDFSNLGAYFPQVPQEIPQIPQIPDYQLPSQVPSFPTFGLPGQGYLYPYRAVQDRVTHEQPAFVAQSALAPGGQPSGFYLSGLQGLTPSVDSSSSETTGTRTSSSSYSNVVPSRTSSSRSTVLSRNGAKKNLDFPSSASLGGRRKRRSLDTEPLYQDQNIVTNKVESFPFNITESEFLKILINVTQQQSHGVKRRPGEYFVDSLNTTVKNSLTADQHRILKIVEDIGSQTTKGLMSQVWQCIRSLSFIRCMGIFVWPVITQNVPSLLGLPTLGSLNPFGRSQETSHFGDIFGMKDGDFEKELILKKEKIEGLLVEWYRGMVEEKFEKTYGFMRIHGYGDGEIGISFNSLGRTERGARIKDHKNLPSILTIISDIMEDMLEQKDPKIDHDKKKEPSKKDNFRRVKSLHEHPVVDDSNEVLTESSRHESSNDDKIIAMFLDKLRSNLTNEDGDANDTNKYLSVADAYEAFELLFGTKLSEKMAEKLDMLNKKYLKPNNHAEDVRETSGEAEDNHGRDKVDGKRNKTDRSGLILRLPQINEEFMNREVTSGLIDLGRKMKMEMSPLVPGISFLVSFFIQMALSHARAVASVAGMMSNMALGSAVLSMVRQTIFGSMANPKIKYVYDNAPMGPGITWPQYH